MSGIRNFILGFCLSVSSFALYGQLNTSTPSKKNSFFHKPVEIDLFRSSESIPHITAIDTIFAQITKTSLDIKQPDISSLQTETGDVLDEVNSSDGIEDDEILNISMNEEIPIELSTPISDTLQAEVMWNDTENKAALLPEDDISSDIQQENTPQNNSDDTSPWIIVKSGSNIKNKKLLEDMKFKEDQDLFTDDVRKITQNDKNVSYKVAEKIKQSIIFPIPDEILNDENLTPTFIHNQDKKTNTSAQPTSREPQRVVSRPQVSAQTKPNTPSKSTANDKSLLDSISSWFSESPAHVNTATKKQNPPAYSSAYASKNIDTHVTTTSKQSKAEDLANFYETMQKTKTERSQRKILPSVLKLSFQPGRAEISGTTLNWLKTFSEATFNEDTYLEVRLAAVTETELQKRRLNLLYTIFMNNGVNFKKINTVFASTEPNALIIRVLKLK